MRKEAAVSWVLMGDWTGEVPHGHRGLGWVLGSPQLHFSSLPVNGVANSVAVQIPRLLPRDVYSAELGWTEICVIRMGSETTYHQPL